MDDAGQQHACGECAKRDSRIAELEERLGKQQAQLNKLESELARAKKHSGNSSKPPSSDIVKPPSDKADAKGAGKKNGQGKRKRGGQPGHPRHERTAFPPEQVDLTWIHYYTGRPCCGGELVESDEPPIVMQQIEIESLPFRVDETGHKENGNRLWTWCFRAALYTVFRALCITVFGVGGVNSSSAQTGIGPLTPSLSPRSSAKTT